MKKLSIFRSLLLAGLIGTLALSAWVVMPVQKAQASGNPIRLVIDNRATGELRLYLEGPAYYYLKVPAETSKTFTIQRGDYDYFLRGCGRTAKGEFHLWQNTRLVNPVCGGSIRVLPNEPTKVDLGASLKVVPVKVISELSYKTMAVFTGPSTYVFTLSPDDELAVTIGKGTYKVTYFACGVNITRKFDAYKNAKFYLRCP